MDENNVAKLDAGDSEGNEYKLEIIWNSMVYAKESMGHLLGLHYLVCLKDYLEKKNT